jgi:hypothetical protein
VRVTLAYPYTTDAGIYYAAGATIDLPEDEAERLVYDGHARPADPGQPISEPQPPAPVAVRARGEWQPATSSVKRVGSKVAALMWLSMTK